MEGRTRPNFYQLKYGRWCEIQRLPPQQAAKLLWHVAYYYFEGEEPTTKLPKDAEKVWWGMRQGIRQYRTSVLNGAKNDGTKPRRKSDEEPTETRRKSRGFPGKTDPETEAVSDSENEEDLEGLLGYLPAGQQNLGTHLGTDLGPL